MNPIDPQERAAELAAYATEYRRLEREGLVTEARLTAASRELLTYGTLDLAPTAPRVNSFAEVLAGIEAAARAEVMAERLDVAVLAQAIDNVTDRTRNAFVGSHVMARYLIEEYLALVPPTEPKT